MILLIFFLKYLDFTIHAVPLFRLYCYAQKHVKSIRAVTKLPDTSMAKSFRSKSSRCKPPKPQTKTKPTSPYHVSDHKAAITVGVIMGVFLVCWVPFFCVNIVAAYCKTCISLRAFQVRGIISDFYLLREGYVYIAFILS